MNSLVLTSVDLGSGNDRFNGGIGANNIFGSDGNDIIAGGNGSIAESGDVGEDTLTGGAGNDRFVLAPNGDSPTIDVIGDGYCCGYWAHYFILLFCYRMFPLLFDEIIYDSGCIFYILTRFVTESAVVIYCLNWIDKYGKLIAKMLSNY
jgi:hypothetical protein